MDSKHSNSDEEWKDQEEKEKQKVFFNVSIKPWHYVDGK